MARLPEVRGVLPPKSIRSFNQDIQPRISLSIGPGKLKAWKRQRRETAWIRLGQGPSLLSFFFYKSPLRISLEQRLKRREDPLDNQAIALSCRMNTIGLVER